MKKPAYRFALLALVLALLAACGDIAVPATATPAPAAGSPVPSASLPPVATSGDAVLTPSPSSPGGATATPAQGDSRSVIGNAASQTRSLSVYRLDFTLVSNLPAVGATGSPTPGQSQQATLLDYKGEFNNNDGHWTYKGLQGTTFGLDPVKGLEVIRYGGTTYALGPLPMSGALEPGWYDLGSDPPDPARPPFLAGDLLLLLLNPDVDLDLFAPAGDETLDGQVCQRFDGGREVTMNALNGLGVNGSGDEKSIEEQMKDMELERTEMSVWVCGDGSIHQITLNAAGRQKAGPPNPFDVRLAFKLTDINGVITITPPQGAVTPVPE